MAKSKKSRRRPAGGNGSSSMTKRGGGNDAETLLKQDHRNVEKLFREFESAEEARKEDIVVQACRELVVHSLLEEELFYPACRDKGVEDDALNEAQVEHDSVKLLVTDLLRGRRDAFYDAKVTVLSEYVKHHVKEEEKKGSGIFAKARKAGVDMNELGSRLQELKQRIEERAGPAGVPPARPRALGIQSDMFNRNQQESFMERDRDERGRFTDDDDNGRGRGGGRGQGRGWFGDSEGHSRAAQQRGGGSSRYEDDDDNGGRGGRGGGRGGSRERDEQGRFMSDDDDDRGGRGGRSGGGRGQGGWFGDPRGHSEASRRGWRDRD